MRLIPAESVRYVARYQIMPTNPVPCPKCEQPLAQLRPMSYQAYVDYYCCVGCGHVWTTEKGTSKVLKHVTVHRSASLHRHAS